MAYSASGLVDRIYSDSSGAFIRLQTASPRPKDGYFRLLLTHKNYDSLYSLALLAAAHRYKLNVRATKNIVANAHAEVAYLTVDW